MRELGVGEARRKGAARGLGEAEEILVIARMPPTTGKRCHPAIGPLRRVLILAQRIRSGLFEARRDVAPALVSFPKLGERATVEDGAVGQQAQRRGCAAPYVGRVRRLIENRSGMSEEDDAPVGGRARLGIAERDNAGNPCVGAKQLEAAGEHPALAICGHVIEEDEASKLDALSRSPGRHASTASLQGWLKTATPTSASPRYSPNRTRADGYEPA